MKEGVICYHSGEVYIHVSFYSGHQIEHKLTCISASCERVGRDLNTV